jgi:hypothetical protein
MADTLDRYDLEFGTPHNAYLLARSENLTNLMLQVNDQVFVLIKFHIQAFVIIHV